MNLNDLFSPLKRQFIWFAAWFLISAGLCFTALQLIPDTQKTTLYFSLKPLSTGADSPTFDHAESTSKMAEAMSGWAKNPQFREDVIKESGVNIANFKRKLSARKQNYVNVFWTLKLYDDEANHHDKVVQALNNQITKRFNALNQDSRAPYAMTEVEVFTESQIIPDWWLVAFALVFGFGLALVFVYLKESTSGKISFAGQLESIFPGAPVLSVSEKLGQHDETLLEQFVLTFESPRLIGTFPSSEKWFSLAPRDALDHTIDTPILLVKLGDTSVNELKNLQAIFGNDVGLVVFHQ